MRSDKWPNFYFWDVTQDKAVKVHKDDVRLTSGSKGRGRGKYYALVAPGKNSDGNDLWKWIKEDKYETLKDHLPKFRRRRRASRRSRSRRRSSKRSSKRRSRR